MASAGSQKKWASEGFTEEAAQTFTEIKSIIDEVAKSSPIDEVTHKIAGVSASAFRNYTQKNGAQRGRISAFTCLNLSEYSGIPYEVFCGRQTFTSEFKDIFKQILINDFSPNNIQNKASRVMFNNKEFLDISLEKLLDYFADIIAEKIIEKQKIEINKEV